MFSMMSGVLLRGLSIGQVAGGDRVTLRADGTHSRFLRLDEGRVEASFSSLPSLVLIVSGSSCSKPTTSFRVSFRATMISSSLA